MSKLEKCFQLIKSAIKLYPTEEVGGVVEKIISDYEKDVTQ